MKKQYLEIGQIVTTHGVMGEVRVKPWCDTPELLCEFDRLFFDGGKTTVGVERARVHKNVVILKLEDINTMDDAQKLRNRVLYCSRDDFELDEGTYFIQDPDRCERCLPHPPGEWKRCAHPRHSGCDRKNRRGRRRDAHPSAQRIV